MRKSTIGATSAKASMNKEKEDSPINSHKDIEGFEQWIGEKDAAELAADAYLNKGVGEVVNGWTIVDSYDEKTEENKVYEELLNRYNILQYNHMTDIRNRVTELFSRPAGDVEIGG